MSISGTAVGAITAVEFIARVFGHIDTLTSFAAAPNMVAMANTWSAAQTSISALCGVAKIDKLGALPKDQEAAMLFKTRVVNLVRGPLSKGALKIADNLVEEDVTQHIDEVKRLETAVDLELLTPNAGMRVLLGAALANPHAFIENELDTATFFHHRALLPLVQYYEVSHNNSVPDYLDPVIRSNAYRAYVYLGVPEHKIDNLLTLKAPPLPIQMVVADQILKITARVIYEDISQEVYNVFGFDRGIIKRALRAGVINHQQYSAARCMIKSQKDNKYRIVELDTQVQNLLQHASNERMQELSRRARVNRIHGYSAFGLIGLDIASMIQQLATNPTLNPLVLSMMLIIGVGLGFSSRFFLNRAYKLDDEYDAEKKRKDDDVEYAPGI